MDFITSIDSSQLNVLIQSASERIILALPGLFKENMKVIESKYLSGFKDIKVILNCSEKIIRQGYGEIGAIQKLREIGVPLFDQPENLVSFIIADNKGFFLFPQSRIFLEESHNVRNAIEMDPFSMEQIIGLFFPPNLFEKKQFEDKLANAVILSAQRIQNIDEILKDGEKIKVSLLKDQKFDPVKKAIESNPPLHPDLKRILEYYTTNYLWIDLKFKGANISNKTINIPQHVLPINSEALRKKLTSNLKLFDNIENASWHYKLKDVNEDVAELRKNYLHPIREKNGMNIISKTDLILFKSSFEVIKQKIAVVIVEVKDEITEEIDGTKEKFKRVLIDYYEKNPTREIANADLESKNKKIEEFVRRIIRPLDFPNADELLGNFSLVYQDYELTSKDLDNEVLLNELIEKKIISAENGKGLKNSYKGYKEKKD